MKYVPVFLDIPVSQEFSYTVDDDFIGFQRVVVEFNNREMWGVAGIPSDQPPQNYDGEIRKIKSVIDSQPIITDELFNLARWISRRYVSSVGEALWSFIPRAERQTRPKWLPQAEKEELPALSGEQSGVWEKVRKFIGRRKNILIKGITGSGKTEIYRYAVRETVESGGSVIVLVPEISLTPQTFHRFSSVAPELVGIYHSKLSKGERLYFWKRAIDGSLKVVVGPRSALFLPLKNLKLIIVDEENEPSYKSNSNPRYDAREVALKRADFNDALVIFGSATPSVETEYESRSQRKNFLFPLFLKSRFFGGGEPDVSIVDMRNHRKSGFFSPLLISKIADRLKNREQVLLFLNRRGFAPAVVCGDCGYVDRCPHCDVSLTLHRREGYLMCHHCGFKKKIPDVCPNCGGRNLKVVGFGTERIEQELGRLFPTSKIARIDADTTRRKWAFQEMFEMIESGNIDIVVGTQMIARGLDFPNMTLTAVVLADITLNLPDYRAAERTFVLVRQVIGRSGRREKKGEAVVQTFKPDHYSIRCAVEGKADEFYEEEIKRRKELNYPPFITLLRVVFRGKVENKVVGTAKAVYEEMRKSLKGEVYPAVECVYRKIADNYRWQVVAKLPRDDESFSQVLNRIREKYHGRKDVFLEVDVNPESML